MTVEISVNKEKNYILVKVLGSINHEEFRDAMRIITSSKDFSPDTNALWDLKKINLAEVDSSFWRGIIRVRKEFPQRGNAMIAHVVEGDFAFGMLRMYCMLSDASDAKLKQSVMVFKDFDKAENWFKTSNNIAEDNY